MNFKVIILVLFPGIVLGQTNYVSNASFEQRDDLCLFCGNVPNSADQLNKCKHWETFNTADWYTTKTFPGAFRGKFNPLGPGQPSNTSNYFMNAHSGNYYAGFGPCEGAQIKLDNKIPQKSLVQFSLWWSPRSLVDSEINLYILKNQAANFSNCTSPGIDMTVHSSIIVNASGGDKVHTPGNWYFYRSDWVFSNLDEYEWFAVKGENNYGKFDANEYMYIDDIEITTRPFCDHPCSPRTGGPPFLNPGSNNVTVPNAMQINVNPWHIYVENAISIEFTVFNRWGGIVFETIEYDPNMLKNPGFNDYVFAWNGVHNNGSALPFDLYNYDIKISNCEKPDLKWKGEVVVFSSPLPLPPLPNPPYTVLPFNTSCCPFCRTLNSNSDGSGVVRTSNCIEAQTNFVVNNGQDVHFDAGENILLKPGVKVNSGGHLLCSIGGCSSSNRIAGDTASNDNEERIRAIDTTFLNMEQIYLTDTEMFLAKSSMTYLNSYPNPVSTQATICFNTGEKDHAEIQIFDIFGSLLYQKHVDSGDDCINYDFTIMKSGIYFVKLVGPTVNKTIKVIKQ